MDGSGAPRGSVHLAGVMSSRARLSDVYSERPSRLAGAVIWTSTTVGAQRILPDGCMDLLWDGSRLVVAGPDTGAFFSDPRPGMCAVGLRFAPGIGPLVFGLPAHEVRDQRVPLDAVWSAACVGRIQSQVEVRLHDLSAVGRLFDDLALNRLGGDARVCDSSAIVQAIGRGAGVDAVAHDLGLSSRQLHRRSLDSFGYGPKLLGRILRLQRTLALARTGMTFAQTAASAGYADQAHQARDVRALAGVPLGQLV